MLGCPLGFSLIYNEKDNRIEVTLIAIRNNLNPVARENATRVELRSPDPACNPYLAFSVMLAAGLEGIEKGYEIPDPVEENVYQMSEEERKARAIGVLPASLWEAIQLTRNSELVRKALGDHVFNAFIENKEIEWGQYRAQVTDYELNKYLPIL